MAFSGYVAEVDKTLCVASATCKEACMFEAIQVDGKPLRAGRLT
jgi:heterodisulfide reductase subunit A-like polyferredoxin